MFLTEYNQAKVLEQERREVERMTYEKVATDMLRKNLPLQLIEEISKLSQDTIQTLADKLSISTSN